MSKFLLLTTVFLSVLNLSGQIAGPRSGSVFSNIAISGSNQSWKNTGHAAASDDHYAVYNSLTGSLPLYTDYLQATGFGFSVPASVNITGIVAEIERSDSNTNTTDYRIRIVKNGAISTTERSAGASYPSADSYHTFGSSGDLWGETWTYADINSSNFGVAIAAQSSVTGKNDGRVDHIRITVYYEFVLLPVKLSAFFAKTNKDNINISWQTTDESKINRYELEKSIDGSVFSTLANMAGKNLTVPVDYSAADLNPNRGINYYRLKMTENTGRTTYSKIISVHFSSGNSVALYPSLWTKGNQLNITNVNGEEIQVDFYSMTGLLINSTVSWGRTVSTSGLKDTKGLVIYKLRNKNGYLTGGGSLLIY